MYDPIVYLSDFWVLMRDLVLVDEENVDKIKRVQGGEKQEGDDDSTEKDIENLNYEGKLFMTWDNWSITYLTYQA